jgi:hypothetical protein
VKYWWKLLFARMGLCVSETNLARMVEYMSEVLVETFIRKNGSVYE